MNIDFFTYLPPEIIIVILSRLPIRTIVFCKLVRKSWRDLLRTREFVDSHLSKSASGLVTCGYNRCLQIFEFVDELDLEHHNLHYNRVIKFDHGEFVSPSNVMGSANGLLFLRVMESQSDEPDALYICNPITRDYIQLPNVYYFPPLVPYRSETGQQLRIVYCYPTLVVCGFGVSKMSGQYKVVRIVYSTNRDCETNIMQSVYGCVCHVYTLGTGKWRKISPGDSLGNDRYSNGAFLDGSLYWLVTDFQGSNWISCFDLETEIFSTFSPPPETGTLHCVVVAFGDNLCMCDNSSGDEVVIWLMKECGDEKSWTKDFVIRKSPEFLRGYSECFEIVYPIKVFKDGDILMAWFDLYMFYYSNKTKTTRRIDMLGACQRGGGFEAMLHTSSFLSLKSFPMENARPF